MKRTLIYVILEIALLTVIVMNPMGTKLASMIHNQLSYGTEPPELIHHLINYLLAVPGIDLIELRSAHQIG